MTVSETASQCVQPPALLLVNLGTPNSPTAPDVRRFLREFLTDRRVIEYHPSWWRLILEGIILRIRPRKVAHAYSTIWTDEGSPLMVGTVAQRQGLARAFGDAVHVREAMCYGSNSLDQALTDLYHQGFRRVVVLPAYPQYSASTVGAVYDIVARWTLRNRDLMSIRMVRSWEESPSYIEALAHALETHWEHHGRPNFDRGDRVLASYHSIPVAMTTQGDPYQEECERTTELLRRRLGLNAEQLSATYQSVFGPAQWIGPATIDTVEELGAAGSGRLDIICPGFVADCLETVEEIGIQNRQAFEAAGGGEFHYVPWANGAQPCVDALVEVACENLAGWVDPQVAEAARSCTYAIGHERGE